MSAATTSYGFADRLVHRVAFHTRPLQLVLADLESSLHAKPLAAAPGEPPVFIASLPRCGTTLLLELLTGSGAFASHSYLDMPFVLCPLLWDRLTRGRRTAAVARERAHGDGVLISHESSEAFEEVIWRAHWPARRGERFAALWAADRRTREVRRVLQENMRKIVLLRSRVATTATRYVSKNNANLARIEILCAAFPAGTIVVPFRSPDAHVASLLEQHRAFGALQARDAFATEYMRFLGHEEFGALLKPIDFPGWSAADRALDAATAEYWYGYWCAAFGHVLSLPLANLCLLDYDALCSRPARSLEQLSARLGLPDAAPLVARAPTVRASRRAGVATSGENAARARALFARLTAAAVNGSDAVS